MCKVYCILHLFVAVSCLEQRTTKKEYFFTISSYRLFVGIVKVSCFSNLFEEDGTYVTE